MSRALTGWLPAVLLVLLVLCTPVSAQSGTAGWSEPVVLTPNANDVAFSPVAAADVEGHLHVVWSQGEGSGGETSMSSIYYASWDGRTWSLPVDVVAARPGAQMSFYKAFAVTPDGQLVLAWSEGSQLLLATAPSNAASSAQAWRTIAMGPGTNPTLGCSPDGERWYLAYWPDTSTLVLVSSDDGGVTWTDPEPVWTAGDDAAGSSTASVVAPNGDLQVVWTENTSRRTWSGEAIWHAAIDANTGIAEVREVSRSEQPHEPTLDGANITACPNGQLHIVWNNGVGSETGRFHQWWNPDTGRWSQVAAIFPGLSGQTSKPGLVCDNTGRVHLLTSAQGGGFGGGLHYATWIGGAWSDYVTLWGGAHAGERPSMAVLGGDELHLAWQLFTLDGEPVNMIAHTYRAIEAASETPVAIARVALTATPSPTPTSTMAAMTQTAGAPVPDDSVPGSGGKFGTIPPLIVGSVAVLLIVGAALWMARTRAR